MAFRGPKEIDDRKNTEAVVEAEGLPRVREMTYVLIHDVTDGGWGFGGNVFTEEQFKDSKPPELAN